MKPPTILKREKSEKGEKGAGKGARKAEEDEKDEEEKGKGKGKGKGKDGKPAEKDNKDWAAVSEARLERGLSNTSSPNSAQAYIVFPIVRHTS